MRTTMLYYNMNVQCKKAIVNLDGIRGLSYKGVVQDLQDLILKLALASSRIPTSLEK